MRVIMRQQIRNGRQRRLQVAYRLRLRNRVINTFNVVQHRSISFGNLFLLNGLSLNSSVRRQSKFGDQFRCTNFIQYQLTRGL